MKKDKQTANMHGRVRVYHGAEKEQQLKAEKQAFVASIAAVAGFSAALLGVGMILGIVGMILGIKAKRPDGKRPVGAVIAIVFGILSIIVGIPGWIVMYGTYINPGSSFVQSIVDFIRGM
jgi:cytochrome c biogenesis protein CcdA